ncbi:trace amine-associated receptor 13c-like [Erpetoichthys calabaricus]|uniref:trace amine-associated receptor 13c-like n=1 Tax=Erpetoichthys calabaricus TaxID=27687 RepID=UPI0010A017FD|nr:trace amine-associated receptor 13c-like [Erpetoichthys calabaricus]
MDIINLEAQQSKQYCYVFNKSCLKEIWAPEVSVILYIFSACSVLLTVFGNFLVIISFSHFRQLHTPSNLLVLSLAVADFFIGGFSMPFELIKLIENCWYFGDTFCFLHSFFSFLLTSVSVSNLVLIAFDRYIAVCDPFFYSAKITIPITGIFIASSWGSSFAYTWALVYFKGVIFTYETINGCLRDCGGLYSEVWGLVDLFATFILPCSLMVSLYVKVFIVARRHLKVINSASEQINKTNKNQGNISKKSERKAAKTLGIVISVYLLCWVPYYLCIIINSYTQIQVPFAVYSIFTSVVCFNSGMNPIIYALFYPWFQKSLKLIITCRVCSPASSLTRMFPEN